MANLRGSNAKVIDRVTKELTRNAQLSLRTLAYRINADYGTVHKLITAGHLRVVGGIQPAPDGYDWRKKKPIPIVALARGVR